MIASAGRRHGGTTDHTGPQHCTSKGDRSTLEENTDRISSGSMRSRSNTAHLWAAGQHAGSGPDHYQVSCWKLYVRMGATTFIRIQDGLFDRSIIGKAGPRDCRPHGRTMGHMQHSDRRPTDMIGFRIKQ